jgi:two-component sensor histidine kinase
VAGTLGEKIISASGRPTIDHAGPEAVAEAGALARAWQARSLLVRYPRAIPAAIFLAIAAITALSVYAIETNAKQSSRAEVRDYAQSIASALERRGNNFSSYLRAGAALFASIDEVSPQTFSQFVAELRLDQNYRGAEGIGWIEVIEPGSSTAYLARVRASQPDFPDIRPPASQAGEVIAPVTYFSPDTSRNRRALGFDMYSEPVRAAAMEEARRTVMPTASGRIVLSQEGAGEAPGFAIFMPVYRSVPQSPTRDRALAGYIFSSFNAGQFLDEAIERSPPTELGVRLYDTETANRHLLVSRSTGAAGTDRFELPVNIANRDLVLVIDSADVRGLAPLSMVTLMFGISLASLLMLILRLLARQAREDEERIAFFEEQNSIRNSLSQELNHRVKNTLANVLSIMSLTRRRASGLDDFADSLEGRVRALSATHDLLTGTDWGTTPIRSVIEAELSHIVSGDAAELVLEGPAVELAPNDALSFGLAIHELATNAAKFGALSVAGGMVSIRWSLESDCLAKVEWSESGGPPVQAARQRGFGTDLIEKIVAHELKHKVELDFRPEGVRCVICVPVRRRSEFQMRKVPAKGQGF